MNVCRVGFVGRSTIINMKTIRPYWQIEDSLHGSCVIVPQSIRYIKNEWHPFGWKICFFAKVRLPNGELKPRSFGATGVDRNTAMANALPRFK